VQIKDGMAPYWQASEFIKRSEVPTQLPLREDRLRLRSPFQISYVLNGGGEGRGVWIKDGMAPYLQAALRQLLHQV